MHSRCGCFVQLLRNCTKTFTPPPKNDSQILIVEGKMGDVELSLGRFIEIRGLECGSIEEKILVIIDDEDKRCRCRVYG